MSGGLQGMRAWVWQRLTALYLALFILAALVWLLVSPPQDAEAWRAALGHPAVTMALALFYLTLLIHAWVGLRDVVLDYIHPFWLRLTALAAVGLWLTVCGLWVAKVLLIASLT